MRTLSYRGYNVEFDHDPTQEDIDQTVAYLDSIPEKQTISKSKAAESGFLNTVLQMSGSMNESLFPKRQTTGYPGGLTASEFTAKQAMEDVAKASEQHPIITGAASAAPMLMPMVSAAPLAIPGLMGGALTSTMGEAAGMQILPRVGIGVPMYHASAGGRKTELMEGDPTKREDATQAARTGAIVDTALGVALPGGYSKPGSGLLSSGLQRAASGGVMQGAAGAIGDVAQNIEAEDRDLKQVDPLDPQRRLPDVLFGAAMGPMAGHTVGEGKLRLEAMELINEINNVAETRGPISKELTTKAIRSADIQALSSEKNLYSIMRTFDKLQESDPIKAQDFLNTILPRVREELLILRVDLASIDKLSTKHPEHGYELRSKGDIAANKIIEKFKLTDEEPITRNTTASDVKQKSTRDILIEEYAKEEDISLEEAHKKIRFDLDVEKIIEELDNKFETKLEEGYVDEITINDVQKPSYDLEIFEQAKNKLEGKIANLETELSKNITDEYRGKLNTSLEQAKKTLAVVKGKLSDYKTNPFPREIYPVREETENIVVTPVTEKNTKLTFDGISGPIQDLVFKMIDKLGISKDELFVRLSKEGTHVQHHQDGTHTVRIEAASIPDNVQRMFSSLSEAEMAKFKLAWSLAHEFGHIVLIKAFKHDIFNGKALKVAEDFLKWSNKNKANAFYSGEGVLSTRAHASADEFSSRFSEYFAQRVADQLINPHKQNIASGYISNIRKIWRHITQFLNITRMPHRATDSLIKDIIRANEDSFKETGKSLWEISAVKYTYDQVKLMNQAYGSKDGNIDYMVSKKSSDEILENTLKGSEEAIPISASTASIAIGKIRKYANNTLDLFMGIQQKRQLFEGNEAVTHAIDVIQNAINTQVAQVNRLLLGEPAKVIDGKRIWSLARSEREDSPKVLLNKATDEDVYAVMKAFQEGFDKWTYAETLKNIGHTLTPDQVKLFKSLSRMFTHLAGLSGGYIPKHRKGWFPVARNGNYTVVLHLPDSHRVRKFEKGEPVLTDAAYVQHFFSKREAEQFVNWFERLPKEERGDLFTKGVEERVVQTENMNARQSLEEELQRAIDNAGDTSAQDIKSVVTEIFDKYKGDRNALAGHRKLRLSIPGYEGDSLTGSVKEQGAAFRDAMFSSVDEFTTYIMKNTIHKELGIFTTSEELKSKFPITHENIDYLERYSTNDGIGIGSDIGKKIDASIDYGTDLIREGFMKGKNPTYSQVHLTDSTIGKLNRLFYIYALIGRPGFWAAQSVQSLWSLRTVAYTGNIFDIFTAGGKGLITLATQPKDFKEALNYVKENRHTFKPSFLNDLNTFHFMELKEGSMALHGMEVLLGEKQSSAADTFSRLTSFAIMYEHYKAQGLKGETLWNKAADKTDENMVQYGRQYKAPIFQEMGLAGQMVAPLATFPQAALGNFLADVRHLAKTPAGQGKLKASLPALTTMVISMTMAGALSAPLIAEIVVLLELINWISRMSTGENLYGSPKEWLLSGNNEILNRVKQHGAISTATTAVVDDGLDVGSSLRWQPMVVGYISGEKQWAETVASLNWAGQMVGSMNTAWGGKFIDNTTSDAEVRKATLNLFPSGPIRAGVDAYKWGLLDRESVPDAKGDMKRKNNSSEIIASFMGTKTLKGSIEESRAWSDKQRKMETGDRRTLLIQNIVDAYEKGNKEKIKSNVEELAIKYHMKPREIQSAIKNELFGRKVPQGVRQFVSTAGKVSDKKKWEYQDYMDRYGVDPFTGEEIEE